MLILEEREHALARGARIYGEVIGYAANRRCLSHDRSGAGRRRRGALHALGAQRRGLAPTDVDYINAHGTSTEYNDANETKAIKTVFRRASGQSCR